MHTNRDFLTGPFWGLNMSTAPTIVEGMLFAGLYGIAIEIQKAYGL